MKCTLEDGVEWDDQYHHKRKRRIKLFIEQRPTDFITTMMSSSTSQHHHNHHQHRHHHHHHRHRLTSILNVFYMISIAVIFNVLLNNSHVSGYELFHTSKQLNSPTKLVNPGERVQIPCSIETPGASVQWILNNKPIQLDFSHNQRRHWNISNERTSLVIKRTTKADEGLWECWQLDTAGNVRQKVPIMRIQLTNRPEEPYIEYSGKSIESGGVITVRENTVTSLHCVIKGQSSNIRAVHWFIGGENHTSQSRLLMEYSAEEDTSLTISVLTMNVTSEHHNQNVQCRIIKSNWAHPTLVSVSFNVLFPPVFSITREPGFGIPILEGTSVSLRCHIEANPPSEVKWERDPDPALANETLSPIVTLSDGSLNFTSISKKDIGWYKCTTRHEFGSFSSFGYFLNVHTREEMPQLTDVLGGEHPQFSESNQENLLQTMRDAQQRKQQAMEGSYQSSKADCPNSVANEAGRPVIESINSTAIAMIGSQINLVARFCCHPRPKKVFWIHRHLAMMPSRVIGRYVTRELVMSSNSMNCFTSSFFIDAVKPEDAGDVMFMVLNQRGADQALISLNVTHSSFSHSSSSISSGSSSIVQLSSSAVLILLTVFSSSILALSIR